MLEKLKNLAILEKPEVTFKRQLSKNPCYPFEKIDGNQFELMLCDRRFYYGCFFTFAIPVFTTIWAIINEPAQYLVFPFVVTVVCATMAWENRGHRRCTLDPNTKQYAFHENGHLTYSGTYNNVYIRLKAQKLGAGSVFYYVVFNGYQMHEQKITSYSTNKKILRNLARKLAASLFLNYFDSNTCSKDHVVRHQRPQPSLSASSPTNTGDIATSPV